MHAVARSSCVILVNVMPAAGENAAAVPFTPQRTSPFMRRQQTPSFVPRVLAVIMPYMPTCHGTRKPLSSLMEEESQHVGRRQKM